MNASIRTQSIHDEKIIAMIPNPPTPYDGNR